VIPLRDALRPRRRAVLTPGIVAACVAVFLLELWVTAEGGDTSLEAFFEQFGLVPANLTAGISTVDPTAAVSLVTHLFLHAGWLHLAGNMLYLWIFGNNVEDRLGHVGFALAYLAFGAIAAGAQVAADPSSRLPLVGASGAISGILGAYVVLYPTARVMSLVFLGFFYQLMEVPAVVLLGLWFALQLISGLASLGAQSEAGGGVAFIAHIGGFVAGAGLGLAIRLADRLRGPPLGLPVG
jgi:membrane associated rhomboid family serine protease